MWFANYLQWDICRQYIRPGQPPHQFWMRLILNASSCFLYFCCSSVNNSQKWHKKCVVCSNITMALWAYAMVQNAFFSFSYFIPTRELERDKNHNKWCSLFAAIWAFNFSGCFIFFLSSLCVCLHSALNRFSLFLQKARAHTNTHRKKDVFAKDNSEYSSVRCRAVAIVLLFNSNFN